MAASDDYTHGAVAARTQGSIGRFLDDLERAGSGVGDELDALEAELAPILRPAEPFDRPDRQSGSSTIGDRVAEFADRLTHMAAGIRQLRARVDL